MKPSLELDSRSFLVGLERQAHRLANDATEELERTGDQVADRARDLAPVDTGELRDSIDARSGREGTVAYVDVGTTDPVGVYQEFGTSNMPPHAFMRPAVAEAPQRFGKGIR